MFMHMLIDSCTIPGDFILDATAATGASIFACQSTGRHIVALEEDKAIFDALLAPLIRLESKPVAPKPTAIIEVVTLTSDDPDEELRDIVPKKKKSRFSKFLGPDLITTRPFFCNPAFFQSPEKTFDLPMYATDMANAYIQGDSRPSRQKLITIDPRVLDFIDVEAAESNGDFVISSSSSSESFEDSL